MPIILKKEHRTHRVVHLPFRVTLNGVSVERHSKTELVNCMPWSDSWAETRLRTIIVDNVRASRQPGNFTITVIVSNVVINPWFI